MKKIEKYLFELYTEEDTGKLAEFVIESLKKEKIETISLIATEAGIELMKLRCSKSTKAVLPSENITGIEFLKNNGFKEAGRIKRMWAGLNVEWCSKGIYNRIAGNFG